MPIKRLSRKLIPRCAAFLRAVPVPRILVIPVKRELHSQKNRQDDGCNVHR